MIQRDLTISDLGRQIVCHHGGYTREGGVKPLGGRPKMDNLFFVSAQGDNIVTLRPVPQKMTRDQALNLAAWIVAITNETEFKITLLAVQRT
jgi:hypothetical protein